MNSPRNKSILELCEARSTPAFKSKQIFDAIYKQNLTQYSQITNIAKWLREDLEAELGDILSLKLLTSVKGENVEKFLFETRDGERIESVLMKYKKGHTSLCISSQIGCAMGCKFCTTGNLVRLQRSLNVDELVDQVLYFYKQGIDIDSVFVSGMGEPFSNPDIFEALNILISKDFMGMSARKISISTVGVIDGIKRLSEEFPQVGLTFSLHSPIEEQRVEIMPINMVYPLPSVMDALDRHILITNKKVLLAYVMLKGVNDSDDHATALAALIKARGSKSYLYHVNLIRFHKGSTKEEFDSSTKEKIDRFMNILKRQGINVTLRMSFGSDIEAACGQLYASYNK